MLIYGFFVLAMDSLGQTLLPLPPEETRRCSKMTVPPIQLPCAEKLI